MHAIALSIAATTLVPSYNFRPSGSAEVARLENKTASKNLYDEDTATTGSTGYGLSIRAKPYPRMLRCGAGCGASSDYLNLLWPCGRRPTRRRHEALLAAAV